MKFGLIFLVSIVAGVLSGEHFHSFMVGFGIAAVAVGAGYWLAFRSTRYPQLAALLLLMGMMAKMTVTVVGVMWSLEANLINSPLVFSLSYLFFSIVVTYLYFKLREFQMNRTSKSAMKKKPLAA
ncbi:NADH:ubiquinone oxidoreductase [Photobacterium sp.]|uniref:NADH:ubiquinone oxidoreductase n=1 Tax=Photobacterium sp. TaxID=660 RepID=UPI00299EFCF8|nr:NADH:ubiquinone oxidoreductase [Photobacterium sp.]MDX1302081.1 NADH:ubiquinone oxidoreductase [Photobacterium sp.]